MWFKSHVSVSSYSSAGLYFPTVTGRGSSGEEPGERGKTSILQLVLSLLFPRSS